ncbi:hypothetical protein BGX23_007376, partial [Mortierella sp. AD031]
LQHFQGAIFIIRENELPFERLEPPIGPRPGWFQEWKEPAAPADATIPLAPPHDN